MLRTKGTDTVYTHTHTHTHTHGSAGAKPECCAEVGAQGEGTFDGDIENIYIWCQLMSSDSCHLGFIVFS